MSLQEQECAFLCVEGGVNEDESKLEDPTLLPAVRPSWSLIPWTLHAPHLDLWILLTPGGDLQYGTVVFSLLMKVESEEVGLKLNIQKTKIMASGPITSWQIDGETVSDFIFLGSKITADVDCSHEIKRHLLLGRKVMTNLDKHIQKQGHYFANKGPFSQGYGFSSGHVWMWELDCEEGWAPKNW